MALLSIISNDLTKDAGTQFKQVSTNFQDILKYTNNIVSKLLIDYTEPAGADVTTASTSYVDMQNFTKNFTVNNPLCNVSFSLSLKGIGVIGIFLNGQAVKEIPFQCVGFTQFNWSNWITMKNGSNQIQIKWKASTGVCTKANSVANPALNFLQILSTNS
jgi:hypothetical protein